MQSKPTHQAAIAILHRENQFLLQLRDDIPHIIFPGQWTLFGGHIEPQEPPEEAIQREIWEEIAYKITDFYLFGQYPHGNAVRYVFAAPLTVPLSQLNLQEGWDMALVPIEEIQAGKCYSPREKDYKPLVPIHRQILLDFWQSGY